MYNAYLHAGLSRRRTSLERGGNREVERILQGMEAEADAEVSVFVHCGIKSGELKEWGIDRLTDWGSESNGLGMRGWW